MPYFPGGGGVAYKGPTIFYRQPTRGSRGRLGQSLSDILGTISDVAGTVSADTSGGGNVGANYWSAPPQSYYSSAPAMSTAAPGFSMTTVLLGAAVVGGLIYFGTKKH